GGGSLEDLWSFNEEVVSRAIAASLIPVVTGIGHEVDVSIADLVADHHAHTPTEGAQVITSRWRGAGEQLEQNADRLTRGLRVLLGDARQRLRSIERHQAFRRPADRLNQLRQVLDDRQRALDVGAERLIQRHRDRLRHATARLDRFLPSVLIRSRDLLNLRRQQLDQKMAARLRVAHERLARATTLLQECHPRLQLKLAEQRLQAVGTRLDLAMARELAERRVLLDANARQLEAVSPRSVLQRGYSITKRKKDGVTLRQASQVKPGEKIITRFADGELESTVQDSKQLSLFEL
ncbi:MAG TPA: exodeoxyribonuclease VII large subunit, partial [Tepidisphaeraceae bacterium]|nr:exodeoxyribonuclease VII large subunit [Tepidisphaeraceae bacterium]